MNYLTVLGKKYHMSGIDDLVESDMRGSPTTSTLLKGKSYNRGVKAHKTVMEVMFRLQWRVVVQWQFPSIHKRRINRPSRIAF